MSSRQIKRDEMEKDMMPESMYEHEARPHITKGGCYALDDRCDTDNSVGARVGQQLHHGRVYSRPAGDCCYRRAVQHHSGAKTSGIKVCKADAKEVSI